MGRDISGWMESGSRRPRRSHRQGRCQSSETAHPNDQRAGSRPPHRRNIEGVATAICEAPSQEYPREIQDVKRRLLFVYLHPSSFVREDLRILGEEYDLVPFRFGWDE